MHKYLLLVSILLPALVYGSNLLPVPYSSPIGATLLPKINVAPTKVNIVKQPITVQQTETVYRSVPVPIRAVTYTHPQVITPIVAQRALLAETWL